MSFLLFPVTINYFSPYVIIDGASEGIVAGSFITFGTLFLGSLFFGRAFCGWVCPGAGLQEACFSISDKRARGWQTQLDKVRHLGALDRPYRRYGRNGGWPAHGESVT